ncbi:hypothetical protein RHS01_09744 [Rhizoctonia solani]|uniref:Uncharacterized protein n=1 Tax=Rhizoctonia solani TaxID=456999 RepID=A0A8H7I3I1_9AGAM|nr:hypothetical protein RHS01_09744 [Rhizoctonia solani]
MLVAEEAASVQTIEGACMIGAQGSKGRSSDPPLTWTNRRIYAQLSVSDRQRQPNTLNRSTYDGKNTEPINKEATTA